MCTAPIFKETLGKKRLFPPILFSWNLCTELFSGKGKMYGSFLAALV
jgi:hypothetical protein